MAETSRFNPPFDRTAWILALCVTVVAVALTFWATSGDEHRQVTATNVSTVGEAQLEPPITQPGPAEPARPTSPGL
jgi:hypothetical protein